MFPTLNSQVLSLKQQTLEHKENVLHVRFNIIIVDYQTTPFSIIVDFLYLL